MRNQSQRLFSVALVFIALGVFGLACGSGDDDSAPTPVPPTATPDPFPKGTALSRADIDALAAMFPDTPLTGGQVAPRQYKWVSEDAALFIQFDKPKPAEATAVRYVGLIVKGVYCAEAQPDRSFTHFDRLSASTYGQGTPSAGEKGYWLTALAVDWFTDQGRQVKPGIDYQYAPMTAPACGANVPAADFAAPGARKISADEISSWGAFFKDELLEGGQVAPRLYRWVSPQTALFIQFDRGNPSATAKFNSSQATSLRFLGLAVRGEFCKSNQPSEDFPHFHRYVAATYGEGHGGPPHTPGIWLLWISTESFEQQTRQVKPGIDRENSVIPIDPC